MAFGPASAQFLAVATASARFTTAMVPGTQYLLVSTTNCWFKVTDGSGSASAAAGSVYLPANVPFPVCTYGALDRVAVIRDTADGSASLAEMRPL